MSQLVYQTVEGRMGKGIHALSMQTFTPEMWIVAGRQASDDQGT